MAGELRVDTIKSTGGIGTISLSGTSTNISNTTYISGNLGIGTNTTTSALYVNGDVILSSINSGPISGARNRIINGAMDIWQRGTSTTTTGNTYLADRWVSSFPTGGTVSRSATAPTDSLYAWNYTASASNTFMQMGQQLEYMNCLDLRNQVVTISFYAKANNVNSGSTTLTVRTRTSSTTVDATVFFAGTNVDSTVTLTTSYVKYSITRTLPASFLSLSLEFVLGSHVITDGFSISQIQLELGPIATIFEKRNYNLELEMCQRYYEKSYALTTVPGTNAGPGTGEWVSVTINAADYYNFGYLPFKTRKRVSPTMTWWSTDGTINTARQQDAANVTATVRTTFNETSGSFGCSGATTNYYHRIHWTSSAEFI